MTQEIKSDVKCFFVGARHGAARIWFIVRACGIREAHSKAMAISCKHFNARPDDVDIHLKEKGK